MYSVELTSTFKADLRETWEYIDQQLRSPGAAANLRTQAIRMALSLEEFPHRFAATQVRETIRYIPIDNFLLFYTVNEDNQTVFLLRFLYGGSDWEKKI